MKNTTAGKLEWFGGNQDALNMYRMLVDLAHTWDDLIDKDGNVPEDHINNAFLIALVYMPANPFYRLIQENVMPMWLTVVSAYEVANQFEKDKDEKGIEGIKYREYTDEYMAKSFDKFALLNARLSALWFRLSNEFNSSDHPLACPQSLTTNIKD